MHRKQPAILAAIICLSLIALARPASAETCEQFNGSASGRKVHVTLENGAAVSGKILRTSPESIVLRSDGKEIDLEKEKIIQIAVRSRSKMLRNALLGAGAGALAGIVFGALNDESDSDSLAIIFGGVGAGAGAGIGAALPS